ncbi:MAG TPA: glycine cleavage system protein GcvH [Pseudonocardia sp.]|jgi:glycine cleavage system H protein|nr:glycine cleavage system protein GcvH [Pseudonocardia sp.]
MSVPTDLQYTAEHEWLRLNGDIATIGITEFAAAALGDVVFVGLPDVGVRLTAGQVCGEVESTKSVSDLYNPVDGEVVEVNAELADEPGAVNTDPYGAGWLFRLRVSGPVELLDAAAYLAQHGGADL